MTEHSATDTPRLLIIGAHPDDAEYHAGGLASIYRQLGRGVKMISVTDGGAGHHSRNPIELVTTRQQESAEAGSVIGAVTESLGFPDGKLLPTIEVRHRIIRELREFKPTLVLTHRTCDYHPDHRATGQAVQDASYLVTVPMVLPDVAALYHAPIFGYMTDLFTRPTKLRVDVALEVESQIHNIVKMLSCHRSQMFEWLPYNENNSASIPEQEQERLEWLQNWYAERSAKKSEHFRDVLRTTFGDANCGDMKYFELFEISEYGSPADQDQLSELFPGARFP